MKELHSRWGMAMYYQEKRFFSILLINLWGIVDESKHVGLLGDTLFIEVIELARFGGFKMLMKIVSFIEGLLQITVTKQLIFITSPLKCPQIRS